MSRQNRSLLPAWYVTHFHDMSLITAHRILIAAAIFLFAIYGLVEVRNYSDSGEGFALVRAAISFAAVVGWALYLRTVKKR